MYNLFNYLSLFFVNNLLLIKASTVSHRYVLTVAKSGRDGGTGEFGSF